MTVREAFEKAFGPLPEGVTGCYLLEIYNSGADVRPVVTTSSAAYGWFEDPSSGWEELELHEPYGPDISNEEAYPFRDFFGGKYKAVVEAEREEELQTHPTPPLIEFLIKHTKPTRKEVPPQ